jgi:hypothetical protein
LPGKTASLAFDAFVGPLSRAISCVTLCTFTATPPNQRGNQTLFLNNGLPCPLSDLFLDARIIFRLVKDERTKIWKASTRGYNYQISDSHKREILCYQWHPSVAPVFPHLHVGPGSEVGDILRKAHIPTGRVSLEEVLRLAIDEFGVRALKANWSTVLKSTQEKFEKFRSWPK